MDLKELTRNKPLMIAVAGAGGLGLFVFIKNRGKNAAGDNGGTSGSSVAGGGTISPGTLDTSGTDIASWMSQYSESFGNQLNQATQDYQKQLTDTQNALGAITKPPTGTIQNLHIDPNSKKGQLHFTWDPVPGAMYYVTHESSKYGGSGAHVVTDTSDVWSGLLSNVQHTISVYAVNAFGQTQPVTVSGTTK